ncbi:uncharacterized protein UHOD_11219 [Ustilago sp. UG-2017b]|nr:uncharacterized protein UHOD_11219 [Ustilago sp. UG-2017b]
MPQLIKGLKLSSFQHPTVSKLQAISMPPRVDSVALLERTMQMIREAHAKWNEDQILECAFSMMNLHPNTRQAEKIPKTVLSIISQIVKLNENNWPSGSPLGGAQVPRLRSQKKTTIAGLGMVEQEARGLAGTGSRHGRNATSMETMDMEDQAVCMEVQAPPQGGPSSRSIQMVTT